MRLAIQARVSWIGSIEVLIEGVVRPVKGTMGRNSQLQPLVPNRSAKLAYDIPVGPHLYGGPVGETAVIHRESIVVFADGDHVFRASLTKQLSPLIGVPI